MAPTAPVLMAAALAGVALFNGRRGRREVFGLGAPPPRARSCPRNALLDKASPSNFNDLIVWVQQNGGFVSEDLEMVEQSGRGISVMSRTSIDAGESLLRIPGSLDLRNSIIGQHSTLLDALDRPENWATQLAAFLALQLDGDSLDSGSFFSPYWQSLALEGVMDMPVFQPAESQDLLQGSSEFGRLAQAQRQAQLVEKLAQLQVEMEGATSLNKTKFLQASCFIAAHVFEDTSGRSRLPPLAINFNHAAGNEVLAKWQWEDSDEVLHIFAARSIPEGTEITISYGARSNAQLLSTYGFTLSPWSEPTFSFRIGAFSEFLPSISQAQGLDYRVRLLTLPRVRRQPQTNDTRAEVTVTDFETAVEKEFRPLEMALERAAEAGVEPMEALQHFVDLSMERYEADSLIAGFITQLRANRKLRPRRWVWWAQEQPADPMRAGHLVLRDASSPSALGSRWRSDVVRMKMSEYLCLSTYRETLALIRGRSNPTKVLPQALDLEPLLKRMLGRLPPVSEI